MLNSRQEISKFKKPNSAAEKKAKFDLLLNSIAQSHVFETFNCADLDLTSLKGVETISTRGDFNCGGNNLTSLEYSPRRVGGSFIAMGNQDLTSFVGAPDYIGEHFYVTGHPSFTTPDFLPNKIGNDCYLFRCQFTSLQGIHKFFKDGYINGKLLIPEFIRSHLLGVLLIPNLQKVTLGAFDKTGKFAVAPTITQNKTGAVFPGNPVTGELFHDIINNKLFVFNGAQWIEAQHADMPLTTSVVELQMALAIINRHLAKDRDVIECQQDLINAGLKAYAQL